ncbi:hypothetical protein FC40_GL000767 [Ligilactobacillus hayakitensis DSM 18933 = JCM 14209]|uniref:Uncharacterized protein n=2 Tax=Ligilactobacillus TaxID=2767887 RepID=A0A0R1WMD4_9LACO|nr:hypothetical protein FC40_GL000767 [Ligilactobacillus hayakitensis DSM 18933 = JCM 14209]
MIDMKLNENNHTPHYRMQKRYEADLKKRTVISLIAVGVTTLANFLYNYLNKNSQNKK